MTPNIRYQDDNYRINKPLLIKVADVYAGNKNIKRKGEAYLSRHNLETTEKYNERLKYATFFPHFRQSISKLENMIFRKGIKVKDNDVFKKLLDNFDGEGSKLQTVMKLAAKKALLDGMTYLWVDAPSFEGAITYKEKEDMNYLPFCKIIDRIDVINKRTKVVNGKTILSKIVIEQLYEDEGDGFQPEAYYITIVLEIGKGTVYKDGEVIQEWTNSLDYIPVIPVYSNKVGYLDADIPFLDLADMNIKHYNAESNLDHINKMVSSPTPLIFDQSDASEDGKIVIGVNNAILFNDKTTGGAEYLEVQGKGIAHLENAVKEIEIKMDKMALNAIYTNTFRTATEARFNEEKNNLFLVEISTSLEDGINTVFKIMSEFLGEDIDLEVELSKDFIDVSIEATMVDELIKLREKGFISSETLWTKLVKSEILDPFDFDTEKEKIKNDIGEVI